MPYVKATFFRPSVRPLSVASYERLTPLWNSHDTQYSSFFTKSRSNTTFVKIDSAFVAGR
jgi:hypothetical protein